MNSDSVTDWSLLYPHSLFLLQSFIQFLTCHARVAFGTEQLHCDFLAGMHQHISIFSFLTTDCHGWRVGEHPAGKQHQCKSEVCTLLLALSRPSCFLSRQPKINQNKILEK